MNAIDEQEQNAADGIAEKKTRIVHNESKEVLAHYGGLIKKYRMASPLKVQDICKRVQISKAQLNQWENGKAEPRLHFMLNLCKVLEIPIDELFRIETGALTSMEANLLQTFRNMNPRLKVKAIAFINELCNLFSDPVFQDSKTSTSINNERIDSADSSDAAKTDEAAEPVVKRGRGRPRKVPEPEDLNAAPRKRGRPKKIQEVSAVDQAPRKRGRPKKVQEPVAVEQAPRKKGRPRKNPLPSGE